MRQQISHVDCIRHLISFVTATVVNSQFFLSRALQVYSIRNEHPFYSIISALNRFTFYVTNFNLKLILISNLRTFTDV